MTITVITILCVLTTSAGACFGFLAAGLCVAARRGDTVEEWRRNVVVYQVAIDKKVGDHLQPAAPPDTGGIGKRGL